MGMRYLWQTFAISETCSVDVGYATATGRRSALRLDHSEYPCCSRSSSSVEIVSSPNLALNSAMACHCQFSVWTVTGFKGLYLLEVFH